MWRKKAFAYFLFLIFLSSFAELVPAYLKIKNFCDNQMIAVAKNIDTFKIIDGKVKTEQAKVYTYKFPDGANFFSVSEKPYVSGDSMLFSVEGDELIFYNAPSFLATRYPLKDLTMGKDIVIDKEKAISIATTIKNTLIIFALPILVFSNLIVNSSYILILMLAAFLMSLNAPLKLNLLQSFNFSVLAITPSVFFQTLSVYFTNYDSASGIYGLISVGLIWYMLRKVSVKKNEAIN